MQPLSNTDSPIIAGHSAPGRFHPSFFFAVSYLIAEYMRPQSMYDSLSGIPFGQIMIVGFLFFFILERREHYNSNIQNFLISAYLFWFFISYLFASRSDLAWQPLIDFSKLVIIYFLLINTINDRSRLYVFTIVLLLLNFKYAQFATRIWVANGFYSDPRGLNAGGGIGSGFFKNPNDLGVALNSVLGISYCLIRSDMQKVAGWFKMRWFHFISAASIAISILATSSRGAALGLAAVSFAVWYKGQRKVVGAALLVVLIMVGIMLIPEDNWARFQKMGSQEDESSESRRAVWRAGMRMANENPLTGVGPNNFIHVNTEYYQSEYRVAQHNVFIQAASELGYPGLSLFLAMIIYCFYNQRRTRKLLREKGIADPFLSGLSHGLDICLVGFVVNGFFITVLYYPFFWMLLILSVSLFDVVMKMGRHPERRPLAAELLMKSAV